MKLKTFKMLDISTGHIEYSDVQLLEAGEDHEFNFSCVQYEEGFYINLGGLNDEPHVRESCKKFSLSFSNLLALAKVQGYDFINFDRDGEVYPELKTFDW